MSGYLLGLAGGLAATPWLARRFGAMRAYTAALLGFTLASAACAAAPDVGLLIAMRVAQGVAGAPMVPLALGLLLGDRGEAAAMPVSAGIMFFAAPALGPAIGGVLIAGFGWRSVFLINVPIGLAALAGTVAGQARQALAAGAADPAARPDVLGLALLGAGLGLATYGASQRTGHRLALVGIGPGLGGRRRLDRRLRGLGPAAVAGRRAAARGQPRVAPLGALGGDPAAVLRRERGAVLHAVPGPGAPPAGPAAIRDRHRPGPAAAGRGHGRRPARWATRSSKAGGPARP